jgi:homopolymeric O-antigen transport system permease protein
VLVTGLENVPAERHRTLIALVKPGPYFRAFREILRLLTRERGLALEMAKRELSAEHTGKALGGFWGWFQPLFLLAVYAFIYGVVFKAKIGGTYELPKNYTVYLLSGLVPWFAFQLAMGRSTGVIVGNANLVKQVVFNLDVLPIASALAACFSLVLGLAFVGTYTIFEYRALPLTYLALPVIMLLSSISPTRSRRHSTRSSG